VDNQLHDEVMAASHLLTEYVNWARMDQLLRGGQYGRAARLLAEASTVCERLDLPLQAHLLTLLHDVCVVCQQSRTQLDHLARAYHTTVQQEQQILATMLNIVLEVGGGAPAVDHDTSAPAEDRGLLNGMLGLRQLVQRLAAVRSGSANGHPLPPPPAPPQLPAGPSPLRLPEPVMAHPAGEGDDTVMAIYCLGAFQVYRHDQVINDWSSRKGKAIFKYLLLNRGHPVPKEVLMDLFWPDSDPDAARNNLNVAIYSLRQTLHRGWPDESHVLFEAGMYLLNPELPMWVDWEAFAALVSTGRQHERADDLPGAIACYASAEALYRGDLLQEDRYEDWAAPQRQQLRADYLQLLNDLGHYYFAQNNLTGCLVICHKLLVLEPCLEAMHRLLMRCYDRQGQRYLAMRQYHQCVEALRTELEVSPAPETIQLYRQICRFTR
jgi:DNA-binding SARP family transcriptional activator